MAIEDPKVSRVVVVATKRDVEEVCKRTKGKLTSSHSRYSRVQEGMSIRRCVEVKERGSTITRKLIAGTPKW